jgi:hypothetical protein
MYIEYNFEIDYSIRKHLTRATNFFRNMLSTRLEKPILWFRFVLTWSEDKNESGLLTTDSHKRLPYKTMEPLDFSRRSGKVFCY